MPRWDPRKNYVAAAADAEAVEAEVPPDDDEKKKNKTAFLLDTAEDEDDMDIDEDVVEQQQQQQQPQQIQVLQSDKLLSKIIVPSPYPQHNSGTSRFRNALNRVTQNPMRDAEAWQAVINEAMTCSNSVNDKSNVDNYKFLDWIESCHGNLIHYFPYAHLHICQVTQILLEQCQAILQTQKQNQQQHRNIVVHANAMDQRYRQCLAKLKSIFHNYLGVAVDDDPEEGNNGLDDDNENDNTNKKKPDNNVPMCDWVVELWLLYIDMVRMETSANRTLEADETQQQPIVVQAYDRAIQAAGASAHNNHKLWKSYLDYVKSWTTSFQQQNNNNLQPADIHKLQQSQMLQLRSIYQRLVQIPMTGLDSYFQEYEGFEKQQNETLGTALIQEWQPKYQHARTVYLERNRIWNIEQLQLGRLATAPVGEKVHRRKHNQREGTASSATAVGATGNTTTTGTATDGGLPTSTSATTGTGVDSTNDEETGHNVHTAMLEEYQLLKIWKVRCAYERTNPGRLNNHQELYHRIRQSYQEMACTLTRHAEPWHMWSTWEAGITTTSDSSSGSSLRQSNNDPHSHHDGGNGVDTSDMAIRVLRLGQVHIPDSTLLAYAHAQWVERKQQGGPASIQVLEDLIARSPSTLAFVLYQQFVRRYRGRDAARAVFAQARRALMEDHSANTVLDAAATEGRRDTATTAGASTEDAAAAEATDGTKTTDEADGRRRGMVMNRTTSATGPTGKTAFLEKTDATAAVKTTVTVSHPIETAGCVTWHLYAAHANMEHRLNRSPHVAARVYELGLRKHASFLTVPAYVEKYAQLLLELNDLKNLRALLTRSVAACSSSGGGGNERDVLAALWDMTLHFETTVAVADPALAKKIQVIEQKRREALVGPEVEDVATGGLLNGGDNDSPALIGSQKSTISEQLVRAEGYDLSSRIVNGMSRTVDVLGAMSLWDGDNDLHSRLRTVKNSSAEDDFPGGKSDLSFQKRSRFQRMVQTGISADAGDGATTGGAGSRILSARERLAGGTSGAGGAQQGGTAIMLAIQQSPDWLRPLLLLLPASRLRLPIVAKPPPHLTEMALSTLLQNSLPSERPADDSMASKRSRAAANDGNSSDEDDGINGGSGYGNAFRARQRRRMAQNGAIGLN